MRILVLGGAGFIGLNYLTYKLREGKDELFCVDALTYASHMEKIQELCQEYEQLTFRRGNICDHSFMSRIFTDWQPEVVVNFAAETHVDRSVANSDVFLQSNYVGVGVLLDCCLQAGGIRYHQVSTDEVYGDLPLTSTAVFTEDSPLRPSNPYSASKAAADMLVLAYHRTYGLPVTISRCTNNYGLYQHSEKFIPHMIECAAAQKKLPLYGNGTNIRDWIHVDDHCRAIEIILEQGNAGQVYNVSASCELSNIELARMILKIKGLDESYLTFVTDRAGHDLRYALSSEKIRGLGWKPLYGKNDFFNQLEQLCR